MLDNEKIERYTSDFSLMIKIIMLNTMGFFFLNFFIPIIADKNMSANTFQIGLIISINLAGLMISSFIAGILTDRIKARSKLILLGSFGRGSAYIVLYIAIIINNFLLLGIGMFVLGAFAGFFWVPIDVLIAEKSHKDNRAHAYGRRESIVAIGQFIGTIVALIFYLFINTQSLPLRKDK